LDQTGGWQELHVELGLRLKLSMWFETNCEMSRDLRAERF